jgi:hypothetical protein
MAATLSGHLRRRYSHLLLVQHLPSWVMPCTDHESLRSQGRVHVIEFRCMLLIAHTRRSCMHGTHTLQGIIQRLNLLAADEGWVRPHPSLNWEVMMRCLLDLADLYASLSSRCSTLILAVFCLCHHRRPRLRRHLESAAMSWTHQHLSGCARQMVTPSGCEEGGTGPKDPSAWRSRCLCMSLSSVFEFRLRFGKFAISRPKGEVHRAACHWTPTATVTRICIALHCLDC